MTGKDRICFFINGAKDDLEAADMLKIKHPNACVSRAYYAMFHAAEAILVTRGMTFKKHSAVIAAFNREFVKTGLLPHETSKTLRKGYEFRLQGDYGPVPVEPEAAEAILKSAGEFVETIEEYLEKEGFLSPEK